MTAIIPKEKRVSALALGTWVGFWGIALIDLISTLMSMMGDEFSHIGTVFFIGIFYVMVGLPIAFILCFLIGFPVFILVNKIRPFDRASAIGMGVFMGTLFGSVSFIVFIREYALWVSILDLLSTIAVGGFAGFWAFQRKSIETFDMKDFD